MENFGSQDKEEIFSKRVPAGKRTYFFDVKATRGNELYLTVTESKKRMRDDGSFFYDKHKIFLYQEDFGKFIEGLNEAIDFVKTNTIPAPDAGGTVVEFNQQQDKPEFEDQVTPTPAIAANKIEDISFDDLGN